MKQLLRKIKQSVYHGRKLYPVYGYLDKVNRLFPLKDLTALEVFAYTGELQTVAYADKCAYLEAWEIDPACLLALQKNLPKAVCKTVDSFGEVKRCGKTFNYINIDNHQGLFGPYCEHFEMFPEVFRLMQPECWVTVNVILSAGDDWRRKYPTLFNAEHLQRRKAFYRCADPAHLSEAEALAAYERIAADHGYQLMAHVFHRRSLNHYLGLHLKRTA